MNKAIMSAAEAVADIPDGASIMVSGFGGAGAPVELVHALLDQGARHLTIVNNNAGTGQIGLAALVRERRVDKVVCSYPRTSDSRNFTEAYMAGRVELELAPQGTLAERIRAAGAGIPAFFTPTAAGTGLGEGKQTQTFGGRECVLEEALHTDYALVKADVADRRGNLTYRLSARNFGPIMCTAAKTTIVQVREIVEIGAIDAETVVTPGIYVDRLVEVADPAQEELLVRAGARYP
ncbi:MAG: 3-oxoacid CoA-transferase subunit A [Pseudomonadota bacterium]